MRVRFSRLRRTEVAPQCPAASVALAVATANSLAAPVENTAQRALISSCASLRQAAPSIEVLLGLRQGQDLFRLLSFWGKNSDFSCLSADALEILCRPNAEARRRHLNLHLKPFPSSRVESTGSKDLPRAGAIVYSRCRSLTDAILRRLRDAREPREHLTHLDSSA